MNFSIRVAGNSGDAFFSVWFNWLFREVLSGRLSLDPVTMLFYPKGVPLGVMGAGPLTAIFGIPFYGMGHYAIYNGAYLLAMAATGYCMFLLARSLGLNKISSIFAGIALEISPLVLQGLFVGHLIKSFQGNLALYLLFLNQLAVDRSHVKRNIIFGALSMLFCLLYDANYFIFAIIATALFVIVKFFQENKSNRLMLFKRLVALTLASIFICSPYLYKLVSSYGSSDFNVRLSNLASSSSYSTDLAAYFLPNSFNTIIGQFTTNLIDYFPNFSPEVGVTIPLTLLFLSIVGLFKFEKKTLFFYLIFVLFFLLAMGPYLRFLGEQIEINGNPILLPFYFLTKIPGLDFIRVPSRFMMIGYVGLAATAGLGLNFLTQKFYKGNILLGLIFLAGFGLESWWVPFPNKQLPDTPEYYVELGENPDDFGVLDLPMTIPGVNTAAYDFGSYTPDAYVYYMLYQMDHHKGIAAGYVARSYLSNPIIEEMDSKHSGLSSPQELTLAGEHPAKFSNLQYELGKLNYRKVVWHKELFGMDYCRKPDSIAFIIGHGLCYEAVEAQEKEMTTFLEQAFGSKQPEYDDGKIIVYDVQTKKDSDLIPNLQYDAHWPEKEEGLQPIPTSAGIITEFPKDVTLKMRMILKSKNGNEVHGLGMIRFLLDGKVIGESEILPTLEMNLKIPKGMNKLIVETSPVSKGQISLEDELIIQEIAFDYQ